MKAIFGVVVAMSLALLAACAGAMVAGDTDGFAARPGTHAR
jgi:hypothetical protein